jgi:hypothetical protein
MLKYIGLSICLCLMAMGLNQVFANQTAAQRHVQKGARSVTNGSNTAAVKPKEADWWKF